MNYKGNINENKYVKYLPNIIYSKILEYYKSDAKIKEFFISHFSKLIFIYMLMIVSLLIITILILI